MSYITGNEHMNPIQEIQEAERAGRSRSRIFFLMAAVLLLQFVSFLIDPTAWRSTFQVGSWLFVIVLMLLLIATGGFLLKPRRIRDLMNDEPTRLNLLIAQAMGFWTTIVAALAAYLLSLFLPVRANDSLHVVATIGVGAALLTFAMRERQAHRLG
jgi:hypothetical protein